MGLNVYDPRPAGISLGDAYAAIRRWYQAIAPSIYDGNDIHGGRFLDFITSLPHAEKLDDVEIRAVLGEVLYGSLEWGYHESDGQFKMAAYAHAALEAAQFGLSLSSAEKLQLAESSLGRLLPERSRNALGLVGYHVNQRIVTVFAQVWDDLIKRLAKNPDEMKNLSSRNFEELIAEIWKKFGYNVELTKKTRDGGRDIVAIGGKVTAEKFLIECKKPVCASTVGVRPVRELYGVKMSEGATKAILATTAHFSKDAGLLFDKHKWELEGRDLEGITQWIDTAIRSKLCRTDNEEVVSPTSRTDSSSKIP